MAELHETIYGKKLLKHDIPEIHRQLKRIADSLELFVEPLAKKKKKYSAVQKKLLKVKLSNIY